MEEEEYVTEKSVYDHATPRPPPTRYRLNELRTSCGLEAPCHQTQGAFLVEQTESTSASAWPSADEFEIEEAARNFQAYLDILREWDEKEKVKEEGLSAKGVRCD